MAKNKRSPSPKQPPLDLPAVGPNQVIRLEPAAVLAAGNRVRLVDCRGSSERRVMAIVGSIAFDARRFEADNPNKRVPIVCVSWIGGRSLVAAYRLAKLGYRVYDLKGGIVAWKLKGYPTVRDF
ncbi:rhodanese-like domain-containing protein [Gloeobacter kilaueensis]|uniref:Rhodanese-related sulfurtransferase n=1 Tax=Gloeobacter kilaueensis (strain ATCC BAA-2537 / CCAP 1431/1 / ULC 316 / JS1) TaxID=1183438 RepID=U5QQI1_GLOK1|nr:rhodanese-like domain-containing protein [Gloeobacter kilaueensis]AGY59940.1 rhodanese-related sulfurtransferase [Gloeobacter kilaueensis JS1]